MARPDPEIEALLRKELAGRVVLLLEDETEWANLAVSYLEPYGVARIDLFETGEAARDAALAQRYDVLLLDRQNPGIDGLAALQAIRAGKGPSSDAPALMITSLGAQAERNQGLLHGADDYVVKGTDELEVVARIAAQIRRAGRAPAQPADDHRLANGPFLVDEKAGSATFRGEPIDLTGKELAILTALARAKGLPITKSMLFKRCWPTLSIYTDGWENTVFQRVHGLRAKLKAIEAELPAALRPVIVNIHGQGYMLRDLDGVS